MPDPSKPADDALDVLVRAFIQGLDYGKVQTGAISWTNANDAFLKKVYRKYMKRKWPVVFTTNSQNWWLLVAQAFALGELARVALDREKVATGKPRLSFSNDFIDEARDLFQVAMSPDTCESLISPRANYRDPKKPWVFEQPIVPLSDTAKKTSDAKILEVGKGCVLCS